MALIEMEPWPLGVCLEFSQAHLESAFVERRYSGMPLETMMLATGIVFGPLKVLTWKDPDALTTLVHHAWVLLTSCGFGGTLLYLMHHHPHKYRRHRLRIMTAARLAIVIGSGLVFARHIPWKVVDPPTTFSRTLSQTPIASMVATLLFPLPFKIHIWVQWLGAMCSWVWVQNLCMTSFFKNAALSHVEKGWLAGLNATKMTTLGYEAETLLPGLGKNCCLPVGLFCHFFFGFLLPTLVVYVIELYARLDFLKRYCDRQLLMSVKVGKLWFLGLVSLVGVQLLWILLRPFGHGNSC